MRRWQQTRQKHLPIFGEDAELYHRFIQLKPSSRLEDDHTHGTRGPGAIVLLLDNSSGASAVQLAWVVGRFAKSAQFNRLLVAKFHRLLRRYSEARQLESCLGP
jgi:hypothetical protein